MDSIKQIKNILKGNIQEVINHLKKLMLIDAAEETYNEIDISKKLPEDDDVVLKSIFDKVIDKIGDVEKKVQRVASK